MNQLLHPAVGAGDTDAFRRSEPAFWRNRAALCVALGAAFFASRPLAMAAGDAAKSSQLGDLGIEELVNTEITSVARRQTLLNHAPAAVAVLTADDLHHLGVTSIPEALRAVPGMQVARLNANSWAITARGFNDQYSNKLLVMVDGRTVYTPTFAGVYWDAQDMVLEDLDRIEIIRGPGATLWGANAVNGVINIISKSAKETQGGLISTAFGTEDQPSVSARYGGQLSSNLYYRVYTKYFRRAGFNDSLGADMNDDWNTARAGFRLDWEPGFENTLTLQGEYYNGNRSENLTKTYALPEATVNFDVSAPNSGGHMLGRWAHRFSEDSELKLQAYYDHYERKHPFGGGALVGGADLTANSNASEARDSVDFDLQHFFQLFDRHELVWGTSFRYTLDHLESRGSAIIPAPERDRQSLFGLFVQDDITLITERLNLTLGSKLEHNDMTGFEVEPAAKLRWMPSEKQSLWGAVSRAVRTPSRLERDLRVDLLALQVPSGSGTPALVSLLSNPDLQSERMLAYEIGYRIEPTKQVRFDLTLFYNQYDQIGRVTLPDQLEATPAPPHVLASPTIHRTGLAAESYGVELLAEYVITDAWRVRASGSWLECSETIGSGTASNPKYQASLQTSYNLGAGWELNFAGYYVDRIESASYAFQPIAIPAYVRFDAGLVWRASERLEFSVFGQNLLDNSHPEFSSYQTARVTEVPRTFYGSVTWRF